ncbi:hypothetical protein BJX70DRAFT_124737 [Aspergillus crustosus]
MEPNSSKDYDAHGSHEPVDSTPDENRDALPKEMESLSLSQDKETHGNPTLNDPDQSDHKVDQGEEQGQEKEQDHNKAESNEEESARTYRIHKLTLRRDSDDPDEEEQESSNLRPEDLYDIVFNFDTPREVDLKVKIKGEFNVTILA